MGSSDGTLFEQWASTRDADAFAEIVARHSAMVYGTCRRVLGNASDAEDVAQECFIELARPGTTIKRSLGGWLHRAAVHRSLNRIKAEKRRKTREARFAARTADHGEMEWDDVQALIDDAIATLPDNLREPVVYRFLEGQTYEAIARNLAVAPSTVQYRVNKGLEGIRTFLKRRGVPVATASLAAMLAAHVSEAAPSTLTASLGKLAIASKVSAGTIGTAATGAAGTTATGIAALGGALIMKKVIIVTAVVAAGVVGLWALTQRQQTEPIESAPELSMPKNGLSEGPAELAVDPGESLPPESEAASADLQQGGAVSGRVVDATTREGIPGVAVFSVSGKINGAMIVAESGQTYRWEPRSPYPFLAPADWTKLSWEAPELPSAVTDKDGGFIITGIPPGRCVMASAVFPGYRPLSSSELKYFKLGENEHHDNVLFVLHPYDGPEVSGRVVDAAGIPVPGAHIWAGAQDKQNIVRANTISEPDGRFLLLGLPSTTRLYAVARKGPMLTEALGPMSLSQEGLKDVNLTLYMPGSIAGHVLNTESNPMSGYQVVSDDRRDMVFWLGTMQLALSLSDEGRHATSDKNGAFQLTGLYPGIYDVLVSRPGEHSYGLPNVRNVEVLAGREISGVLVVVDDRGTLRITGYVTDATGNPVPKARISAWNRNERSSAVTDENGYYELAELREGDYGIRVSAQRFSRLSAEAVPAGSTDVNFVLQAAGAVAGRVLHAKTGEPLLDARVGKREGAWKGLSMADIRAGIEVNAKDGAFWFDDISAGYATILAEAPGFVPAGLTVTVEPGGGAEALIRLEPGATVKGIVHDPEANPIPHAGVFLDTLPWESLRDEFLVSRSDVRGTFIVTGLPAEPTRLVAHHPDYAPGYVIVTPGAENEVEIVLSVGGTIQGTLSYDGVPLANQGVGMLLEEDLAENPISIESRTDETGVFRIEHACPGPVFVRAYIRFDGEPGFKRWVTHNAVVQDRGITQVNIEPRSGSATVEGHISADGMSPFRGSRIYMEVSGSEGYSFFHMFRDPDGTFGAVEVPAGTATLDINFETEHDGVRHHRYVTADITEGESVWLDIELTE